MRVLTELDYQILTTARKMFISQGIMKTEMKDIAAELNCSRSTLYRHFANKGEILFLLAQKATGLTYETMHIPEGLHFATGYDAVEWQLKRAAETFILHVEDVTFLRDFDCFFTREYPDMPEVEDYLAAVRERMAKDPLLEQWQIGVADGSIRAVENPELFLLTVSQGMTALAQRVLPREQHYVSMHGYGQEILWQYVKTVLASIRNVS